MLVHRAVTVRVRPGSIAQATKLAQLARAYQGFSQRGGFPRWCAQARDKDSFRIECLKDRKSLVQDSHLRIPGLGWYRLTGQNRYTHLQPLSVTVYRDTGQGHAAILYQVPATRPARKDVPDKPAGLDRNVRQIALHDGTLHEVPDVEKLYRKRDRLQHKSQRRARTQLRIQRTWRQIRMINQTWCPKISKDLAAAHDLIVATKLNMQGMTRSSQAKPGTNGKQKRGLNRSLRRSHGGQRVSYLAYKTHVELVDPVYMSPTCSRCGRVHADNRQTRALYVCAVCGLRMHADTNAAINILDRGVPACGTGSESGPSGRGEMGSSPACETSTGTSG